MKWLGKFPDPFLAEIAGQPEAMRRAAAALPEQVAALEAIGRASADRGGVVFTGMGASYDACYPAVNELAARGVLALQIDTAELLHFRSHLLSPSTLLVMVSQSGRSAEVVRLAETLRQRRERPVMLSITNGISNPLAELTDLRLDTRAGAESGPSTMTFVASLVHLAAAASVLSAETTALAMARSREAADAAANGVETLLAGGEAIVERMADGVRGHDVVALLGRGPARAATEMGALTLKECGVLAESYETAAFRHGPFELAGPGLAAIVVVTEPETRSLDIGLAAELVEAGASVVVVSTGDEAPDGSIAIHVPTGDRLLAPAVSIVPIQLLAWRLAGADGRVPGTYSKASKVTTRE